MSMCISVLISSGYELTKYRINRVVIKEKGILLGGVSDCEELSGGEVTVDDGVDFRVCS